MIEKVKVMRPRTVQEEYEVEKWQTRDGCQFDYESRAIAHEKLLDVLDIRNRVRYIHSGVAEENLNLLSRESGDWYLLTNAEDVKALLLASGNVRYISGYENVEVDPAWLVNEWITFKIYDADEYLVNKCLDVDVFTLEWIKDNWNKFLKQFETKE